MQKTGGYIASEYDYTALSIKTDQPNALMNSVNLPSIKNLKTKLADAEGREIIKLVENDVALLINVQ